ncbi:hypothetical protein IIE63_000774 [Listeria monocytogenes]|uniref:Uncharacterized protein n=1 Tax=Listeria monocytogenes TaxID=1639 RepID=A0A823ITX9_LISMN|nr:hypothetical protein [Listeria monocytogenes]EAG9223059.1 hypothetical protein [Listeria monocytogenes]EAG9354864.1 hypothetical protein [Listeria monocytogenes]EGN0214405.1 hypothetical protein [Listeria monocytogenes]EHY0679303.1 hypothetical protein [Listeria monocytogenes]EIY6893389.1 hypothetical protein [Listeria monocytogenes]
MFINNYLPYYIIYFDGKSIVQTLLHTSALSTIAAFAFAISSAPVYIFSNACIYTFTFSPANSPANTASSNLKLAVSE